MFFSSCLKHKGFVFTMDILVAIILLTTFLPIATLQKVPERNYLKSVQLKQLSSDIANSLEEEEGSNSAMAILDDLALTDEEKTQRVYDKIAGMAPKNMHVRVETKKYAPLITPACKLQQNFTVCFPQPATTITKGPELPDSKDITHEKILLVRKSRSGECTWGGS